MFLRSTDTARDTALLPFHSQIKISHPGEAALQTGLTGLAEHVTQCYDSASSQPTMQ